LEDEYDIRTVQELLWHNEREDGNFSHIKPYDINVKTFLRYKFLPIPFND